MGRNIPLSVSQAWFNSILLLDTAAWYPLLHCFFAQFFLASYNVLHIQRVMSCASGEALAVKVGPPGSSENVLHILFFFKGGFEGELI